MTERDIPSHVIETLKAESLEGVRLDDAEWMRYYTYFLMKVESEGSEGPMEEVIERLTHEGTYAVPAMLLRINGNYVLRVHEAFSSITVISGDSVVEFYA